MMLVGFGLYFLFWILFAVFVPVESGAIIIGK